MYTSEKFFEFLHGDFQAPENREGACGQAAAEMAQFRAMKIILSRVQKNPGFF